MLRTILSVLMLLTSASLYAEDNPQYLEALEISNGHNHVCALTTAGVKCFGNEETLTTKVPLTLKNPHHLQTGNRFSCAMVDDGIRCWGDIPNNSRTDLLISHATLPQPKLLSVGFNHACAVSSKDQIKCWGQNEYKESTPPANLKNITELSLGMNNSCAIADNTVVCWGLELAGSLDVPVNLINPRKLTSGLWHHCVQTDEGMKCWGNPYKEFVQPDDPNIKDIVSGGMYNCALVAEGVKCWNEKGKTALVENSLGATKISIGSFMACATTPTTGVLCWKLSDAPVLKPLLSFVPSGGIANIENLSAGNASTCAYGDNGKLKCWGANFDEALNVPAEIPGPLSQLSLGAHKTCAIKDRVLSCWGSSNTDFNIPKNLGLVDYVSSGGNHICAGTAEKLKCWGDNARGALDVPKELAQFTKLSSGMLHSCAVAQDQVNCWGGEGLIKNVNPPEKMTSPRAICTGATFSCGIDNNGKVSCWGEQIPLTYRGLKREIANEVLKVPKEIEDATEISCGVSHGCALYNGKIKCWGSGSFFPERLAPPPSIKNPRSLTAGWYHNCAIGDNGLTCWGKMIGLNMPDYSLVK